MDYHSFDPDTGAYIGTFPADEDPLDGGYLLPAHATFVSPPEFEDGFVRCFAGGTWTQVPFKSLFPDPEPEPEPEPYFPETISDRQFFQVLANRQLITKAEALAAVSVGTLPAAMDALLAGMPEDEEFAARMLLQGATQFNRSHPLTLAFGAGFGMTPEQIDELWIEAEAL